MRSLILIAVVLVTSIALPATPGAAQSSASTKLEGIFDDYSDVANTAGAWHIVGEWSANIKGKSDKVDFVASLTMKRATSGASPHTHHVGLFDGTVTEIANGLAFTGQATITGNGALAAFSGSPVRIEVTGDPAVIPHASVRIIFSGGAVGHFGADPVDGVVTIRP